MNLDPALSTRDLFPHPPQIPAVTARGVTCRFGATVALDRVSLTLDPGRCLALVGPNGAGKSTVLAVLQGRVRATAGRVFVHGQPPGAASIARCVGIVLQGTDVPPQLTPRDVIGFASAHFAEPVPLQELTGDFGLGDLLDRRMGGFSGGEMRRVALALGFVGRPDLVFLDEPTAGLDAAARAEVHARLLRFRDAGGTLILASHHWDEIDTLADSILVLHRGRVLREGPRAHVLADLPSRRIRFRLPPGLRTPDWLAHTFTRRDDTFEATLPDTDALLRRLVAENLPFEALEVQPLGLHDIIVGLAAIIGEAPEPATSPRSTSGLTA